MRSANATDELSHQPPGTQDIKKKFQLVKNLGIGGVVGVKVSPPKAVVPGSIYVNTNSSASAPSDSLFRRQAFFSQSFLVYFPSQNLSFFSLPLTQVAQGLISLLSLSLSLSLSLPLSLSISLLEPAININLLSSISSTRKKLFFVVLSS